jgi:hypothetical protein
MSMLEYSPFGSTESVSSSATQPTSNPSNDPPRAVSRPARRIVRSNSLDDRQPTMRMTCRRQAGGSPGLPERSTSQVVWALSPEMPLKVAQGWCLVRLRCSQARKARGNNRRVSPTPGSLEGPVPAWFVGTVRRERIDHVPLDTEPVPESISGVSTCCEHGPARSGLAGWNGPGAENVAVLRCCDGRSIIGLGCRGARSRRARRCLWPCRTHRSRLVRRSG